MPVTREKGTDGGEGVESTGADHAGELGGGAVGGASSSSALTPGGVTAGVPRVKAVARRGQMADTDDEADDDDEEDGMGVGGSLAHRMARLAEQGRAGGAVGLEATPAPGASSNDEIGGGVAADADAIARRRTKRSRPMGPLATPLNAFDASPPAKRPAAFASAPDFPDAPLHATAASAAESPLPPAGSGRRSSADHLDAAASLAGLPASVAGGAAGVATAASFADTPSASAAAPWNASSSSSSSSSSLAAASAAAPPGYSAGEAATHEPATSTAASTAASFVAAAARMSSGMPALLQAASEATSDHTLPTGHAADGGFAPAAALAGPDDRPAPRRRMPAAKAHSSERAGHASSAAPHPAIDDAPEDAPPHETLVKAALMPTLPAMARAVLASPCLTSVMQVAFSRDADPGDVAMAEPFIHAVMDAADAAGSAGSHRPIVRASRLLEAAGASEAAAAAAAVEALLVGPGAPPSSPSHAQPAADTPSWGPKVRRRLGEDLPDFGKDAHAAGLAAVVAGLAVAGALRLPCKSASADPDNHSDAPPAVDDVLVGLLMGQRSTAIAAPNSPDTMRRSRKPPHRPPDRPPASARRPFPVVLARRVADRLCSVETADQEGALLTLRYTAGVSEADALFAGRAVVLARCLFDWAQQRDAPLRAAVAVARRSPPQPPLDADGYGGGATETASHSAQQQAPAPTPGRPGQGPSKGKRSASRRRAPARIVAPPASTGTASSAASPRDIGGGSSSSAAAGGGAPRGRASKRLRSSGASANTTATATAADDDAAAAAAAVDDFAGDSGVSAVHATPGAGRASSRSNADLSDAALALAGLSTGGSRAHASRHVGVAPSPSGFGGAGAGDGSQSSLLSPGVFGQPRGVGAGEFSSPGGLSMPPPSAAKGRDIDDGQAADEGAVPLGSPEPTFTSSRLEAVGGIAARRSASRSRSLRAKLASGAARGSDGRDDDHDEDDDDDAHSTGMRAMADLHGSPAPTAARGASAARRAAVRRSPRTASPRRDATQSAVASASGGVRRSSRRR